MSMYGTYSESLKARSIWTVLEPAFTASGILSLQGIYVFWPLVNHTISPML